MGLLESDIKSGGKVSRNTPAQVQVPKVGRKSDQSTGAAFDYQSGRLPMNRRPRAIDDGDKSGDANRPLHPQKNVIPTKILTERMMMVMPPRGMRRDR